MPSVMAPCAMFPMSIQRRKHKKCYNIGPLNNRCIVFLTTTLAPEDRCVLNRTLTAIVSVIMLSVNVPNVMAPCAMLPIVKGV